MVDQSERIAALEREVEALMGIATGLFAGLNAVAAVTPDRNAMVKRLMIVTESVETGAFGTVLNQRQHRFARTVLEHLLRTETEPGAKRPPSV